MAPPVRRAAVVAAPVVKNYVSFGSMDFYSGSRSIPENDYALEFNWQNFTPKKPDGTPLGTMRLVVMVSHYPMTGGNVIEFPLGVGEKAHESFQPDPDNPKCLLAVPGGPGQSISKLSNWGIYLGSLYHPVLEPEAGLPEGTLDNDFSVIDGLQAHVMMQPEPEARKNLPKSTTAELQGDDQRKGSGLVPMVMSILPDGKPWEGTGGFPDGATAPAPAAPVAPTPAPARRAPAAPAARPAAAPAAAPRAAARPVARPTTAPPVVAAPSGVDENLLAAATMAAADVFAKYPDGVERNAFRMELFKILQATSNAAEANAIVKPIFATDVALNQLVNPLSFIVENGNVLPMQ